MEFYDPEVWNYYSSMARGYQPEPYKYFQPIVAQQTNLETEIEMELKAKTAEFSREEAVFVEQMMFKNPVVVERRQSLADQEERSAESIQRAESCRKSRVNNKIKKAKMRFRHQFASQKMKESALLLSQIHGLIAEAEAQLLRRRFPINRIRYLREQFGVESATTTPSSSSSTSSASSTSSSALWQGYNGYQ